MATAAFFILILSAGIQASYLFRTEGKTPSFARYLPLIASLLLFGTIVQRSFQIHFFALTNTFESLVFYAGVLSLLLFFYRMQKKIPYSPFIEFGALVFAIALLAVASSPLAPQTVLPPIPALKSLWLLLHVSFSFIGEAFFVISFVASAAMLLSRDEAKKLSYDRITYTAIAVGYPIFTAGALVFGAVWAEKAWGRYWSWDPKETWALVTWLVYTAYLHIRLIRKRQDSIAAWLSITGFLCTLFTFFGVNYLLKGLHSYG